MKKTFRSPCASVFFRPKLARPRGVSLVELMVGLVVALVLSLIMFNVFIVSEEQRRTTSAGSDAQQSGAFSTYTLERHLRMAGAGMGQIPRGGPQSPIWGCLLSASKDGKVLSPLPSGTPEPFSSLGVDNLMIAPLLIVNGSKSGDDNPAGTAPDAIVVMGGTQPNVSNWFQIRDATNANNAPVLNSVGLRTNDLLIAVEATPGQPNYNTCPVVQATSKVNLNKADPNYRQSEDEVGRVITVGGSYTASGGMAPNGNAFSQQSFFANLGQNPVFRIFALGPSTTAPQELLEYNILLEPDKAVQQLAEGVVNMQAVYGIATGANPNVVTAWVPPTGDFRADALMNGSAASAANLGRIRAVRVAVIVRSAQPERTEVSPKSWSVFADDAELEIGGDRSPDEQRYRYQQFDFVVPLRSVLLFSSPT